MAREARGVLIFESLLLGCAVLAGTLDWQAEKQTLDTRALIFAQITAGLIGLTVVVLRGSHFLIAGLLVFGHFAYGVRTQSLQRAVFPGLYFLEFFLHLLELWLAVWFIWRGAQELRRK